MGKRSYTSPPPTECESGAPKCLTDAQRKAKAMVLKEIAPLVPLDLYYDEAVLRVVEDHSEASILLVLTPSKLRVIMRALA